MSEKIEFGLRAILIGVGATMVMDVWALLLRQFGIPSLNFAYLGRRIGHLRQGHRMHESIARATPVRGELLIGWSAHYSIGITFAALLLSTFGLRWARSPSLLPALIIGIVTVLAPLLILQPALGAGIASSKTPTPVFNCIKSLVTHTAYGFGLFLAALATASLTARPGGNRNRMRYGEFHAAGLCTSTAVVESGCKQAIGLRLKPGGMFWTVHGADTIIALRCSRLSGRFEDFWERRSSAQFG
jgi:hypothetical protein